MLWVDIYFWWLFLTTGTHLSIITSPACSSDSLEQVGRRAGGQAGRQAGTYICNYEEKYFVSLTHKYNSIEQAQSWCKTLIPAESSNAYCRTHQQHLQPCSYRYMPHIQLLTRHTHRDTHTDTHRHTHTHTYTHIHTHTHTHTRDIVKQPEEELKNSETVVSLFWVYRK